MRKTKTGRRANDREKQLAQSVIELYRKAQAAPGGLLPINAGDGEPLFFDGNDPSEALSALEHFAKHGTFEWVDSEPADLLVLNLEFDELRESGVSYGDAVHVLAERKNMSERNIERYLAKRLQSLPFFKSSVKIA